MMPEAIMDRDPERGRASAPVTTGARPALFRGLSHPHARRLARFIAIFLDRYTDFADWHQGGKYYGRKIAVLEVSQQP